MNTEKFCVEFEKIFGQCKSKRMKRCRRVVSGSKTMISSPYCNFLYEVSLYLKIRVSGLKTLFATDCEYLYSLSEKVYKRFRRRFRKNCRKSGLATYKTGENLHKCFSKYWYDMLDQILQKLFIESRMTLEFLFYETIVLTFEFSIRRKNEKRQHEIICIKTKDLL